MVCFLLIVSHWLAFLLLFSSEMSTHSLLVRPACLVTHQSLQLSISDAFQVTDRLLPAMELLPADRSCCGLEAPAQRTGAPSWGPQRRGELAELSLPPIPALLEAGQGQLPRGREPSGAPGNLVGLRRLSSGGLGAAEAVGPERRDP